MAEDREEGWERRVLERLALEVLAEQRRRRRWGAFLRLSTLALVAAVLWVFGGFAEVEPLDGGRHTALVSLEGEIAAKGEVSADHVVASLQAAFADSGTQGVVLRINSPGGSPVQAGIISDEILRLRALHPEVPVFAVVEDICASGGYYVAAVADRIYVDKASIVGSIGVLMDGFGFAGLMERLGIERRLLTAGDNKGFLDPFSPQQPKQLAHARVMLQEIHTQFVDTVRKGRGERLKETPEMFSGLMWSGAKSVEMGLADGFGTVDSVAREVIKAETIRDYTQKQNLAERFAQRFGAGMAERAASVLAGSPLR
ncbi:MAG: S49 family peptidase [Zoogloea sp.]|uniref:S49 family peptidase n=1 Tax=Zoogloea sp. TaxID=49181 RepID=UPI00262B06B7|nr:S49 family peptidase [Zoogloea sp.]MDD3325820.1 S49 family peptidase [Zoogloea sp.]